MLQQYPHPSTQSESWARQWLSPEHPCIYFWEWGHWAQDCPRKRAGKTAEADPRIWKPDFKLKKYQHVLHTALERVEMGRGIAGIAEIPENDSLVLIDSGASNHVMSN
ncbi:hypothetical protein O181_012808 [Austropuccinia psidii MF-1]|uniref:Gag-pol polyprotein n=1 Tax=Austropuccinia psidii MF-1 TaxID=1389203 RepID=A0A9Q3GMJ3_9BASI|nr:hypothetical protein [Austropuccinia psidii MF-1]